MQIEVRSKAMATIFNPGTPWACISVVTQPGSWPEFIKDQPTAIIRLSFCDLDMTQPELQEYYKDGEGDHMGVPYFNREFAKEIMDFYLSVQEMEWLLVHCEAGWSRSPAIAAALDKIFKDDDMKWFANYSPNRFVYRLLIDEAVERGLIG